VGQAQPGTGDLPFPRLALQLLVHFVEHAEAGGADGVAEALQAAVRVDRQGTVRQERAIQDVFPARARGAEPEILVVYEFSYGETVVNLREVDLPPRVDDTGLLPALRRIPGNRSRSGNRA
jgi:hypothetical protein